MAQVTSTNPAPAAATKTDKGSAMAFGASEVLKLYQGGISKEVLISYIENNSLPFHLTADNIIYLQKVGLPQEVIAALIRRDGELQRQSLAAAQQPWNPALTAPNSAVPPGNMPPPVVAPNSPAPVVAPYPPDAGAQVVVPPPVVYPDYSVYPYYGYPYYYGPDVVIAGGWRWGWGPRGWGWGHGFAGHGFDHRR